MVKVLVINGPNLNMLGTRQPNIYGMGTLKELEAQCIQWGAEKSVNVTCKQSNHEGEIIECIQKAPMHPLNMGAIILNAGAYTHTSIAISDAVAAIDIPTYEVHLSNIYNREPFREHSYISRVAVGVIAGLGYVGYKVAIEAIAHNQSVRGTHTYT